MTAHVEALRTTKILTFTTYTTSKNEYNNNLKLWEYLNKNRNSLNDEGYFVFNVCFTGPLYNLFKFLKKIKIKILKLSIALRYIIDTDKREIIKNKIYEPIFNKAMNIVGQYFYNYLPSSLFYQKYIDSNPDYFRKFSRTFLVSVFIY